MSVFADQCNILTGGDLSSDDLYKMLGRKDSSFGESAKLFEAAENDPTIRAKLIHAIQENKILQSFSASGLQFKNDLEEFLKSKAPAQDLNAILYPRNQLQNIYEDFKRRLKDPLDTPYNDQEAALAARYDTAMRFGLDPNYSEQDILYSPDRQSIDLFFNRQANRYLQMDLQKVRRIDTVDIRRFRIWVQKMLEYTEHARAKNLLDMLLEIAKFDDSIESVVRTNLDAKKQPKNDVTIKPDVDYVNGASILKTIPEFTESIFSLSFKEESLVGMDRSRRWKRGLGGYIAYDGYEKVDFIKLLKKKKIQSPDGFIHFKTANREFNAAVYKAFKRGTNIPEEVDYLIPLKEIYELLDLYAQILGKTSFDDVNSLANKILFTFYYEEALANNVKILSEQIEQTNILSFESNLRLTSSQELEQFNGRSPTQSTQNFLQRSRRLLNEMPADEVTGVEWFGYQNHNNFWIDRDLKFEKKKNNPLASGVLANLRDKFAKAQVRTQGLILAGTLSAAFYILMPELSWDLLPGFGKSISEWVDHGSPVKIKDDAKAKAPQPKEDPKSKKKAGGGNPILFTTYATVLDNPLTIAKYTNPPLIYEIRPRGPRYYNYGTEFDLADSALFKQIFIPNDTLNSWPQGIQLERLTLKSTKNHFEIADSAFVAIPVPEGYGLDQVILTDTTTNNTDVIEALYMHPHNGFVYAKVRDSVRTHPFRMVVSASRPYEPELGIELKDGKLEIHETGASKNANQMALHDPRFKNLSIDSLTKIAGRAREAGLSHVADALEWTLKKHAPDSSGVTINDLARAISKFELYNEKVPELVDTASLANNFVKWKPYLNQDGILVFKCNTSNQLLTEILRQYYVADPDIVIGPYRSHVLDSTQVKNEGKGPHENGWITSIGHERTQIYSKKNPGLIILDATPTKRAGEDKDKKRGFGPWPEAEEPEQRRSRAENPPATEGASPKKQHELMIEKLERITGILVEHPSFKSLVQSNSGTFTPQRVYILAKKILYYAREELSLDALYTQMDSLYPELDLKAPSDPNTLVDDVLRIQELEIKAWEASQSTFDSLVQSQKDSARKLEWAVDMHLRQRVTDAIELLRSYHWIAPKE